MLGACCIVGCALAFAAEPPFGKEFQFFLEDHCFDCHDGGTTKAGLDLESLAFDSSDPQNLAIWTHVHDRVLSGEMPPKKKARPDADELSAFIKAGTDPILRAWSDIYKRSGRTAGRRLNPTEYEYTLRDLLNAQWLELKDMLPPDAEAHGFDNVADAQEISYIQMSCYLDAAQVAIDRAMLLGSKSKPSTVRVKFGGEGRMYGKGEYAGKGSNETRVVGDWLVLLRQPNNAQAPYDISGKRQREAGWYKFRVRCRAVHFQNGELLPPKRGHVGQLNTSAKRVLGSFDIPEDPEGGVVEFTAWLYEGDGLEYSSSTLDDRNPPPLQKFGIDHPYNAEAIAIDYFEIEGPFTTEACDKDAVQAPSYQALFGDLPTKRWTPESGLQHPERLHIPDLTADKNGLDDPFAFPKDNMMVVAEDPEKDARRLLSSFMERAYRRPVEEAELERCLTFATEAIARKACFQDAMRPAFTAALCSPDFLYFRESPGKLDGYALASRLSYFLWRSLPDEALISAAKADELGDKEGLLAQMNRMLADPKADRFIADFTGQWLDLNAIYETSPDQNLYPEYFCDTHLIDSAVAETRATFREMLAEDLPASTVVDSDFLMINERLATLYEIDGIRGSKLRPVKLPPASPRGGIITQASVLKVTANGLTTSPVVRGVWVLDRLLGNHPPPPPPSAGSIDPDTRGTTTVREQLAKHSTAESCATCHVHIDPPGFALENFDVMGSWRDNYRSFEDGEKVERKFALRDVKYKTGLPVNASGKTEEGQDFSDIHDFRKYLLSKEEMVSKNLANRLLTFSTGAGITLADREEISRILNDTKPSGHGLRSMLAEIITSNTFLSK